MFCSRMRVEASVEEPNPEEPNPEEEINEPYLTVIGYNVTHASNARARDGRVVCSIVGETQSERFLWSNGAITSRPILEYVPKGTYAMVSTTKHTKHLCLPACVLVRPSSE